MNGPTYTSKAAKSLLSRAVQRPRTPPKLASDRLIRGGRVMEDADSKTWSPVKASKSASSRGDASGPPNDKESAGAGTASFRPDLMMSQNSSSSRTLIEKEMRIAEFMEKNQGAPRTGDDDAWSEINTERGGKPAASRKRMRAVFDAFDKDRSGSISALELDSVLRELRIYKTPEEVAKLMAEADLDGTPHGHPNRIGRSTHPLLACMRAQYFNAAVHTLLRVRENRQRGAGL